MCLLVSAQTKRMDPLDLVRKKLTLFNDPERTDPAVMILVLDYNVVSKEHEVNVEGGKATTREDLARMMKKYPHHHGRSCTSARRRPGP